MWTAANILTMGRLAVLPAIVVLIWPGIESRETCFWAAVLYAVGGWLDLVDGYVARRWHQVTVLGKFLDPLADKLFHLVTLIGLLQLPGPRVPPWVVMILLTRELAITGLRGIAVSEGVVIAAGQGGKLKTAFASFGTVGLLLHYPYVINYGFAAQMVDFHLVGLWLTYMAVASSVISGTEYVVGFVRARGKRDIERGSDP